MKARVHGESGDALVDQAHRETDAPDVVGAIGWLDGRFAGSVGSRLVVAVVAATAVAAAAAVEIAAASVEQSRNQKQD